MTMASSGHEALLRLDLKPPERTTLDDRVYLELREQIISGRLRPGDSLSIRTLAGLLDVSPMPVRTALRRLADEGALDGRPNRTYTIRILAPDEFREILALRLLLEGEAAEQAAGRLGPADVARLRSINDHMYRDEPFDAETFLNLNRQFHFLIYGANRAPLTMRFIESLWLQIGPLLNLVMHDSHTRHGEAIHKAALAAAERSDGPALRKAVVTDISEAGGPILDWLERNSR
jgi:DNA-binding GntR family transcriptional regulator